MAAPPTGERPLIDQWVLSEAARVARDVDDALENFDTQRGGPDTRGVHR